LEKAEKLFKFSIQQINYLITLLNMDSVNVSLLSLHSQPGPAAVNYMQSTTIAPQSKTFEDIILNSEFL